jgi:hypothetical protein
MLQFIGKPPNANFKVYFDRTWTEPMIFDIQDKQLWMPEPICMFF